MGETEGLVPLVEACAKASLPYYVAWAAVVAGRVRAVRVGNRWMVHLQELRKLARERGQVPAPA